MVTPTGWAGRSKILRVVRSFSGDGFTTRCANVWWLIRVQYHRSSTSKTVILGGLSLHHPLAICTLTGVFDNPTFFETESNTKCLGLLWEPMVLVIFLDKKILAGIVKASKNSQELTKLGGGVSFQGGSLSSFRLFSTWFPKISLEFALSILHNPTGFPVPSPLQPRFSGSLWKMDHTSLSNGTSTRKMTFTNQNPCSSSQEVTHFERASSCWWKICHKPVGVPKAVINF